MAEPSIGQRAVHLLGVGIYLPERQGKPCQPAVKLTCLCQLHRLTLDRRFIVRRMGSMLAAERGLGEVVDADREHQPAY